MHNFTCLFDPSLINKRNLLVLSTAEISLPACLQLVLRLEAQLPGRICAEHADCPQPTLEPGLESGISGVAFVRLPPALKLSCSYLAAKGNALDNAKGHSTVCAPSCWLMDSCMGCTQASLMPGFSGLSSESRNSSRSKHGNAQYSTARALLYFFDRWPNVKRWKGNNSELVSLFT